MQLEVLICDHLHISLLFISFCDCCHLQPVSYVV